MSSSGECASVARSATVDAGRRRPPAGTALAFRFVTGTSLAAPHVAGALALLLSAYPDLTVAEQEAALISSSVDLGAGGPDNDYGYGRLDALAAYRWLAAGGSTVAPSTVSVGLFPGLNLVSLRLTPDGSAAPAEVLGSIAGSYERVYAARACDVADPWKVYDPAVPDFVNDLAAIDPTMGLWVKMTAAGILTVSGTAPSRTAVPLCSGWNLIGYPSIQKRPPAEVLAPIAGLFERVYTFDAGDPSDPWKLYDPAVPNFVNDISVFQAGFGYPTAGEKPGCGADGLVIHFAVGGVAVQQEVIFKSGEITQLDLSAGAEGQPTPPVPSATPAASPTASATPTTTPTATHPPAHTLTGMPAATPSRTASVQATVPLPGRELYLPVVLRMSPASGSAPAESRASPGRIPHRCCIPL